MKRLVSTTLCKLLQRQTYTCLSSKYAMWMLIGGLLLTIISAFQFGEVVLEWSMQKYAVTFNAYHDNIAEESFQSRLCLPMPIDIVYTWVNGSDPRLLVQLESLKRQVEKELNKTKLLEHDKLKIANSSEELKGGSAVEKILRSKNRKKTDKMKVSTMTSNECPFANCIPALSLVVEEGLPASLTLFQVRELGVSFKSAKKVFNITLLGSVEEKVTVIQFSNEQQVANALQVKVKWNEQRFRTTEAFFTSDLSKHTGVKAETEVMITGIKSQEHIEKVKQYFRRRMGNKLLEIKYHRQKKVAVAYFSDKKTVESVLEQSKNITIKGEAVQINPAKFVWTLFSVTKHDSNDDYTESEFIASRFADNEELRYSLRSVEKHAPWVRKIFIVTNGQIPAWINLDNPRIKIVTHHEIFPNISHLPTFSSPAIESHLHRIPGLSQKFVYMNDDVMFGDDVWPDDFYTHSKGQKIYLTWPVPNCNEGCPSSWINDKYCDKACNTSECDWDGGDCLNVKPKSRWGYGGWHGQQTSFKLEFCNTGCADTWVGDRYCDAACNVAKCGFDAGDCGVDQFFQLYGVVVTMATKYVSIPSSVDAMYFNLTLIFGKGKISEGDFSSNAVLRSATIAQRHKTLTLTFRKNQTSLFSLHMKGFADKNESKPVEIKFNVSVFEDTSKDSASKTFDATVVTSQYQDKQSSTFGPNINNKVTTTLYPIRIHSGPLNYWNTGNRSYPLPTWPTLDYEQDDRYYENLQLGNLTSLPQHIKSALIHLDKELSDGDLTLKGYKRRRAKLLQNYFKTSNNSSSTVSSFATLELPTQNQIIKMLKTPPGQHNVSGTSHVTGIGETIENIDSPVKVENNSENKDMHLRHLLSMANWSEDDGYADIATAATGQFGMVSNDAVFLNIRRIKNNKQVNGPSEDEIFVSNWIADSKKKLLSYDKDFEEGTKEWVNRYGDWYPAVHPEETSFLPWERTGDFQGYHEREKKMEILAGYETRPLRRRKLMDTFADSLLHVHRIYNRKFGYTARKVPAHMPHMIDVKIMNELQAMLPCEFDQTSSHRLRSSDDMQFAFSFMYFVMGQKKQLNLNEVFSEVDTDHSGTLSDRELRILATRIFPLPLDIKTLKQFEKTLINCSLNISHAQKYATDLPTEKYFVSDMPLITKDFLSTCDPVISLLNESIKSQTKYRYETLGDEDVAFKMIRDNATAVMLQLDNIRGKRKKFVCLNDNIDHGTKEADVIKALLVDFYESLFPVPSQFELGRNYKNRFLYMDELKDYLKEREMVQKWTNVFMLACVILGIIFMFCKKIRSVLKILFGFGRRFGQGSARLMTV